MNTTLTGGDEWMLRKKKASYILHKVTESNIKLCKVLNEYDNIETANSELVKLLTNETNEKTILKNYSKKDIFKK